MKKALGVERRNWGGGVVYFHCVSAYPLIECLRNLGGGVVCSSLRIRVSGYADIVPSAGYSVVKPKLASTCAQIWARPKSTQVIVNPRKWLAKRNASWTQVQNLRRLASPFGQGLTTGQNKDCFCFLLNLLRYCPNRSKRAHKSLINANCWNTASSSTPTPFQ